MMFQSYMRRVAVALILGAALAPGLGCAGAGRTGGSEPPTASRAASRRVLLSDELHGVTAVDVYEAVQRLRPEWLRRRGQISIQDPTAGEVVVYLDGVRFGGPRSLQNVRIESVQHMEYLDAGDATMRFGTGHGGGAILVRTR
jgi:hypothetical protein